MIGIFSNFHCRAQAVPVACQWRKLHLSWIYCYPVAMICTLKTNPIGFFVRIVCAPLGALRTIVCFITNFLIPGAKTLYFALFAPFISLFHNLQQLIIAFAIAHPQFCLSILYFIKFLLSPIRLCVALLSPIVKCDRQCYYTSECIVCKTGNLFYYPLRLFEIPIVTVDDWIKFLRSLLENEPIINEPEEPIITEPTEIVDKENTDLVTEKELNLLDALFNLDGDYTKLEQIIESLNTFITSKLFEAEK